MTEETRELIPGQHQQTGLSVYGQFSDPLAAVEAMGEWFFRSGMFGCKKPEQGKILALESMVTGRPPMEIARTNHIVDGRLAKKSMAMLAELREFGGDYEWAEDGSDGQKATLKIKPPGKKEWKTCTYTIQDAQRAGLVKPNSNWEKTPANMLRARVTSNAIGMYAPQIVVGYATPEEIEDDQQQSTKDAKEVEARRQELAQMQSGEPLKETQPETADAPEPDGEAAPETAGSSIPPAETELPPGGEPGQQPGLATDAQLRRIADLVEKLGMSAEQFDDSVVRGRLRLSRRQELSYNQAKTIIENAETRLAKKN